MIRRAPKPAPIEPAVDWDALADEFALAFDKTASIKESLRKAFTAWRMGGAVIGREWIGSLVAEVAHRHGVTVEDMMDVSSRNYEHARARFEAYALMRRRDIGWTDIGRYFGVHHTTVMHGVEKFEAVVAEAREAAAGPVVDDAAPGERKAA